MRSANPYKSQSIRNPSFSKTPHVMAINAVIGDENEYERMFMALTVEIFLSTRHMKNCNAITERTDDLIKICGSGFSPFRTIIRTSSHLSNNLSPSIKTAS